MTLREDAAISVHTGILLYESFQPVHEYIEEILGGDTSISNSDIG